MRPITASAGALVAAIAMALGVAAPAAAAPGTTKREPHPRVDTVTVSNPVPTRDSAIEVFSAGWRPGSIVAISLAGADLRRARADTTGAIRAEVRVPADAQSGFGLLAVTGASATGVPQQVVTGLSVVADHPQRAPSRPWLVIFLLLALATVLLLVSQRVESGKPRTTRVAG